MPQNISDDFKAATVMNHVFGKASPGRTALMQFQHPEVAERTIVLLAATSGQDLSAGSKALWDPVVQSGCRGDLAFLNLEAADRNAFSMIVGPNYYLGKPGPVPIIPNIVNAHPLIFLFALMIVLILLLGLTLVFLKNRRNKRIAKSNA
jgi:hypothetical protein